MMEFFSFKKMVTPMIIQIIFWIGVVGCVIGGLILIVAGATARVGGGAQVLTGIFTIFLGSLGVRIFCELTLVLFRILDELKRR